MYVSLSIYSLEEVEEVEEGEVEEEEEGEVREKEGEGVELTWGWLWVFCLPSLVSFSSSSSAVSGYSSPSSHV